MGEGEPAANQLGLQLVGLVDADVATLVGVVFVGQQPADPFGQPPRHGHRQLAAWLEDPDQFGDRGVVGGDVLEDLGGDHAVEARVRIGQRQRIADHDLRLGRFGCLARLAHRLQQGVDVGQFGGVLVEGDDVGAAPVRLEAVPSGAAADVDDLGSRSDGEPVVVDGQHGSSTASTVSVMRPVRAMACS